MKKLILIACFILFLTIFNFNITYAKSDFDSYDWQKLNNYFTGKDIIGATNNGSLFVAVGEHGLILKSSDGITWEKVYCGYEEDFNSIKWDGKLFKAITQSGRVLTSDKGDKWVLQAKRADVDTKTATNIDPRHIVSQNKIFEFSKRGNIAIAVGEAGTIYYGTKNVQKLIKQTALNTNSHIIDKLGNAIVLFVGSSQMYVENNYQEHTIPKPYIISTEKETVYVPVAEIVKSMGGSYEFDQKESTAYIKYKSNKITIKIGAKTINLNGKDKYIQFPAVFKDNVLFAPLNTFALLGKQTYFNQNLVVISDIKEFFGKENEYLIIDTMKIIFNSTDHKVTSLSEKLIDTLTDEGLKYLDTYDPNDCFDALDYFEMAELIEPSSETYINIGWSWQEVEDYDFAIESFDKGLKLNSVSFDLYLNKANALSELGNFHDALKSINKANEINPGAIEVTAAIAFLNIQRCDYDEAIQGYDKCILKDPSITTFYLNKGYSLMQLGKYQEAIESYDKVIVIDPKEIRSFWQKGQCLYKLQKYAEAIIEYDNALKLNPEAELIIESKGDALLKLNMFYETALEYKKAIEIQPDYEQFRKKYEDVLLSIEKFGDDLSGTEKYDEAISEYNKALVFLTTQFDYERVAIKKAELLFRTKRYEQLEIMEFKDEYNGNALSCYYKALVYYAQGKYDDAIKYIRHSISYNSSYRRKIYKDERFCNLKEREDYRVIMSDIKFFMDDTFLFDGAEFFEDSVFEGATFYKASTLRSSSVDNTIIIIVNNIYDKLLSNKINNKEEALKIGFSKNSHILSIFDQENSRILFDYDYRQILYTFDYEAVEEEIPEFSAKDNKILGSDIIMIGNVNGVPKFVVTHTKIERSTDIGSEEIDTYSVLIKEEDSWKFLVGLN